MNEFYNDINPIKCQWVKRLIENNEIPKGTVSNDDIQKINPQKIKNYKRIHFFCGIAGWPLALKISGFPPTRPVWTASLPCQAWSCAGKQKGISDSRHLWPAFFRLVQKFKPQLIFGEQVAAAISLGWLDGVFTDFESEGYTCGAVVLSARCVKAPHVRKRIMFVAYSTGNGRERIQRFAKAQIQKDWSPKALDAWHGTGNPFEQWQKLLAGTCIRRMDDGVSSGMVVGPALRSFGDAIVPQAAAAFVRAFIEEENQ